MSNFRASVIAAALAVGLSSAASALPALQLGPDTDPNWAYDPGPETWVLAGLDGTVNAYANAADGNGKYAWDTEGSGTQTAYLVVSAVPGSDAGDGAVFSLTVMNDGAALTLFTSGFGTPPLEDPNSLAPHGIFPTYFEIYQFTFDDAALLISDQQPGGSGTGNGFMEAFDISGVTLDEGLYGLHFDLFVVQGDGVLDLGSSDRQTVNAFAPFSHDAEFRLPEPGPLGLLGLGLMALYIGRRRRFAK